MKLPVPFVQLPLLFDADRLASEIGSLGEDAWLPHPQGFAGNSMLPLVAVNGEPANEGFRGAMRPTPHLRRCPYVEQVLASHGATIGRTRLMRLSGGAEVTRHADQGYYWADRVRVHVPIVTQPTVRFECGGATVNMARGESWIFDTWRQHRVLNQDDRPRVHLVMDTVGGDGFWSLVGQGRDHGAAPPRAIWQPRFIDFDSAITPDPLFETVNIPTVMTPWEITQRIRFLLAEAVPHPMLAVVQQAASVFCRQWHGLWAAFGERQAGWASYRQAVDAFMRAVAQPSSGIVLRNELGFYGALASLVGQMAVADVLEESSPVRPGGDGSIPGVTPRGLKDVALEDDPEFDRPIFIVSTPRAGSTLLFETLAQGRGIFTIGDESHALIEGIPALHPLRNGIESNRLGETEATVQIAGELRARFLGALVDRQGLRPPAYPVRMLEKTPKNALRIPFLQKVFPQARFVYLHREPVETIASMLDAWQSGRFVTYPGLPGWRGAPWSLLLTPGWKDLVGRPLEEIVVRQWEAATKVLLDDLAAVPAARVACVSYATLVSQPGAAISKLCGELEIVWDRAIDGALPLSRYTLSAPDPDKWKRHYGKLEPYLRGLQKTIDRAREFMQRN